MQYIFHRFFYFFNFSKYKYGMIVIYDYAPNEGKSNMTADRKMEIALCKFEKNTPTLMCKVKRPTLHYTIMNKLWQHKYSKHNETELRFFHLGKFRTPPPNIIYITHINTFNECLLSNTVTSYQEKPFFCPRK